jgi:cytochrome c553
MLRQLSTMIAAGAVLAFAGLPALAQDAMDAKAIVCSACHGQNGVPSDPKTMPIIWGQRADYLFKQLVNYRNGMREHPIMSAIAKGIQQPDLRPMAVYFSGKTWPARTAGAAPGEEPKGIAMCKACHQPNFEGGPPAPRLAGLSYEYLANSMKAFATEQRTNNGDMPKIMQMFTEAERDAMAKYMSAL